MVHWKPLKYGKWNWQMKFIIQFIILYFLLKSHIDNHFKISLSLLESSPDLLSPYLFITFTHKYRHTHTHTHTHTYTHTGCLLFSAWPWPASVVGSITLHVTVALSSSTGSYIFWDLFCPSRFWAPMMPCIQLGTGEPFARRFWSVTRIVNLST